MSKRDAESCSYLSVERLERTLSCRDDLLVVRSERIELGLQHALLLDTNNHSSANQILAARDSQRSYYAKQQQQQ